LAAKRKNIVLTLIRCGENTWNDEGRLHGRSDLPLSIAGRASVSSDVDVLAGRHLATVYHPPDDAASETAQIVSRAVRARGKSVADLSEASLGVLEGLTTQVFADRFPKRYKQWQDDPLSLSPPDGEDLADARARLFAAVKRLVRRSRSDELGLVLHPLSLGFLRCWLAERPPTDVWTLVRNRPRIERYLVAPEMLGWLVEAGKAQYTHS
jgi:broad specificity phosphatase PhoE